MKRSTNMPIENMIQSMRQIRDEISNEIKGMSFTEEREFLDQVLKPKRLTSNSSKKHIPAK
jgi:hypothetical protein